MELRFSTRSRFFDPIRRVLTEPHALEGRAVSVHLGEGGYERDVHVSIDPHDPLTFNSDWNGKDPSRFSARIRAAATVLRDRGF